MAILTVQTLSRTGTDVASAAMTACDVAGDSFPNTGTEYAMFENTNGSDRTVTLVIQKTVDGQAVTNKTVTVVATTGRKIVGPFGTDYNDANTRVNFTYSAVTGLKVAILKQGTTS